LQLVGGTMTGPLLLSADPTVSGEAATKNYVDGLAGQFLPLTGGTLSGPLQAETSFVTNVTGTGAGYIQLNINTNIAGSLNNTSIGFWNRNLLNGAGMYHGVAPLAGVRFGALTATGGATGATWLTLAAAEATFNVPLRMQGTGNNPVLLGGDPTAPLQAATKQYVDAVAGGGGPVTVVTDGVSILGDGAIATPLTVALIDGGTF
jgi:hypothetical protein